MRIANIADRAVLIDGNKALDIHGATGGNFGPSVMDIYEKWEQFSALEESLVGRVAVEGHPFEDSELGIPVPRPRQIFAIGLNYKDHADEASLPYPTHLFVFTKFASCLAAPNADVVVPEGEVDYETELVVTIGKELHQVSEDQALDGVAGYSVGQDFSERSTQLRPPVPQFSLGKSFPGFGPFGPAVVTASELENPSALSISAVLEGPSAATSPATPESAGGDAGSESSEWKVQDGNTENMIFPVAAIISELSKIVTLYPGDLIFTGTPAGVGKAHGIALQPGDILTSTITSVGSIRNRLI